MENKTFFENRIQKKLGIYSDVFLHGNVCVIRLSNC